MQDTRTSLALRILWVAAIVGNLWLVWDIVSETESGRAAKEWVVGHSRRIVQEAKECQGCARRREWLRQRWEQRVSGAAESAVMEAEAIIAHHGEAAE